MKTWKRRWIAALALALALSLTACGGPNTQGSSSGEGSSSSSSQVEELEEPLLLKEEELGFQVELPVLLKDHMSTETTQREAYGETISTVSVYYQGENDSTAHVLSLEEMSQEAWEKLQAEGGPLGVLLGESPEGRVVVLNTLQSNPFAEGTAEYDLFNELPSQLSVVTESFQFLG